MTATDALTEREVAMLAFEARWWQYQGPKETAVRQEFGISATSYYVALNELIDTDAALAHDPLLVKRLRRLRAARAHERNARRLGFDLDGDTC